MNSRTLLYFMIITYSLTACHQQKEETNSQKHSKPTEVSVQETKKRKSNFEMLQGKWQSEDDKTIFLIFENNIRKEFAEGMEDLDSEAFILSDHYENKSNLADTSEKEKDSYISCKKSDLCWYIMSLNDEKLTLQYMGRGNTLMYTRVKH